VSVLQCLPVTVLIDCLPVHSTINTPFNQGERTAHRSVSEEKSLSGSIQENFWKDFSRFKERMASCKLPVTSVPVTVLIHYFPVTVLVHCFPVTFLIDCLPVTVLIDCFPVTVLQCLPVTVLIDCLPVTVLIHCYSDKL
jgi:hypothetical protein